MATFLSDYFGIDSAVVEKYGAVGEAITLTVAKFPMLLDYYILYKEQHGDAAASESFAKVRSSEQFFIRQVGEFQKLLHMHTGFYGVHGEGAI